MLRVEVVTQLSAEPDEFQAQWSRLASRCAYASVFQTPQWLATWWHALGNKALRSLYILAVFDGAELVGLAPLMRSGWYGLPLRRLSFLGTGSSDYGDFLAVHGREREVCDTLYANLLSHRNWSLLDLREAREGGLVRSFLPDHGSGLIYSISPLEPCPYLDLPTDGGPDEKWAQLLQRYSKKMRANINYYERTLGKTFDVEHLSATDDAELESAFEHLFALHASRWRRRWLPGVFGSKAVRSFHIAAGKRLLRIDALRLRQIQLDGECVAVLYVFAFNGRSCYYQGGFEPDLARYSLGSVLIARAIRGAIEEGHSVFDFLRGGEEYKRRWTRDQRRVNARVFIGRSRMVLAVANAIHGIEQLIEVNAKRAFAGGLIRKAPKPARADEE